MAAEREWCVYAHEYPEGFRHMFPDMRPTRMSNPAREVVLVRLVEDEEGEYCGWRYAGDKKICLVQRAALFAMQFPYGPQAEADAGRGEIIRLRAEKVVV